MNAGGEVLHAGSFTIVGVASASSSSSSSASASSSSASILYYTLYKTLYCRKFDHDLAN